MINASDDTDPAMFVESLPIGVFPLLDAMFAPDSSDSERAAVIVGLLQIGLRSEEELWIAM